MSQKWLHPTSCQLVIIPSNIIFLIPIYSGIVINTNKCILELRYGGLWFLGLPNWQILNSLYCIMCIINTSLNLTISVIVLENKFKIFNNIEVARTSTDCWVHAADQVQVYYWGLTWGSKMISKEEQNARLLTPPRKIDEICDC